MRAFGLSFFPPFPFEIPSSAPLGDVIPHLGVLIDVVRAEQYLDDLHITSRRYEVIETTHGVIRYLPMLMQGRAVAVPHRGDERLIWTRHKMLKDVLVKIILRRNADALPIHSVI